MSYVITYKSPLFNQTSEIFSGTDLIGSLTHKTWQQQATGIIYNKTYRFDTKGFFKSETTITDLTDNRIIGNISYNTWNSKAKITLSSGEIYDWTYENIWQSKWIMTGPENKTIRSKASTTKGEIYLDDIDELLILAGMYITSYFSQNNMVIIIAVLIPLFAAAS